MPLSAAASAVQAALSSIAAQDRLFFDVQEVTLPHPSGIVTR
jgi:hypothetical protein